MRRAWRQHGVLLIGLSLVNAGVNACARSPHLPAAQLSRGDFTRLFEATVFIRSLGPDGVSREGSGFVATENGWIISSFHVVGSTQAAVLVEYANGQISRSELVYGWPERDLAVIIPREPAPLEPLRLGDSARLEAGQALFACGVPLGLGRTLTRGLVESRTAFESPRYVVWDGILADGLSYPGDSGGPVVNEEGKVVGVHLGSVGGRRRALIPSSLIRRTLVEAQVRAEIRRRHQALESASLALPLSPQ